MQNRPHHEILGLDEKAIQAATDKQIQKAYQEKIVALQDEREAALKKSRMNVMDEFDEKRRKVELAFEALKNELNRRQYLEQLRRDNANPIITSTSINDKTKEIALRVDEKTSQKLLEEYDNFVKATYKNSLDKYKPKENRYATLDEYKNSDHYKSLSAEEKKKVNDDNFPKKVIALHFDDWKDALKFMKDMTQKGVFKPGSDVEFEKSLIEKGLIKPEAEQEEKAAYKSPSPFNTQCKPK